MNGAAEDEEWSTFDEDGVEHLRWVRSGVDERHAVDDIRSPAVFLRSKTSECFGGDMTGGIVSMGMWRRGLRRSAMSTSRRFKQMMVCVCILASVVPLVFFNYHTISYSLRPLWDTPPKPFQVIPYYYAEGTSMSQLCKIHGWVQRKTPRRVFDAIIFSNEIDILEIRMQELMPYVTKFIVLESNATFTGQPKALFFQQFKDSRFKFIHSQLEHIVLPSRPYIPDEDPFINERYQRHAMHPALIHAGLQDGDLLITADADEIPSAHTIRLLQNCDGYPQRMHLQLRNYIYSFEFPVDYNSWRSSAQIFSRNSFSYSHARHSDFLLADAGWHCSFCFRHIQDFEFKMQAYSHADRVRHPSFLNPDRIQAIVCKGTDLFGMLPEEFSFKELLSKLGAVARSFSGVHLPKPVVDNSTAYSFLLPGNCLRHRPLEQQSTR